MLLPPTYDRVTFNTREDINCRIHQAMEQRLVYYALRPEEIEQRLCDLDEEWDVERTLETNASTLALAGLGLGLLADRRFLVLPAVVAGFLLQHALQGWCPPLPILRRLGVRTQGEIESERYCLKALRGDFDQMGELAPSAGEPPDPVIRVVHALRAVEC